MSLAMESNTNPQNEDVHLDTSCNHTEDGGMGYDSDLASNSEWGSEEEFSDDCVSPVQAIFAASDEESWPGDVLPENEGDW